MAASPRAMALLASPALHGTRRLGLLKELERLTGEAWAAEAPTAAAAALAALGGAAAAAAARLERAALHQQLAGIPEAGPQFHAVLAACRRRQELQRRAVVAALSHLDHGWDSLDRALIVHAALVASAYDAFHAAWLAAVQGPLAAELAAADREGRLPRDLYCRYTVIEKAADGGYTQRAYAAAFPAEVGAICGELENWAAVLEDVDTDHSSVKEQYLQYLRQYRACLAETDVSRLDALWARLDVLWLAIRHPVQVVHDMEYGYVDPLRTKAQPEFSLRILDDEVFRCQNAVLAAVQDLLVSYYQRRPSRLAAEGLAGLRRSSTGIYYQPFLTGVALHLRFVAQAIPNRSEVRREHGVKIYLDAAAAAARAAAARVLADPGRAEALDLLDALVYLVAPHEAGHAVMSLDCVRQVIAPATKTLLEEPRAELTTLCLLREMRRGSQLRQDQLERLLCVFMLSDLRRLQARDAQARRPYTVSAMSCWARAEAVGYVTLEGQGRVVMHDSKVPAFLDASALVFESILDAEDAADGPAFEGILAQLQAGAGSAVVQHLVAALHEPAAAGEAAAGPAAGEAAAGPAAGEAA